MSTRIKVGAGFAIVAVMILALGVAMHVSTQRQREANEQKDHTHKVLERLEHLASILKDAENGQRGYILTGDEKYLEPYNTATGNLQSELDEIAQLTQDNPQQQKDLAQVKTLVDAKMAELRETIALRRASDIAAALPTIKSNRGKQIMDDLLRVLAGMESREARLLEERSAAAERSEQRTLWMIALWIPAALVVFAVISVILAGTLRMAGPVKPLEPPRDRLARVVIRYASAVIFVAIGVVMRVWLVNSFGQLPTFVTLYPAVLLAATIGGGGPGILATVLAALAGEYYFIEPYNAFAIAGTNDLLGLGIFTGANVFLCVLAERLRRSRWTEALSVAQEKQIDHLSQLNDQLGRQAEELTQQSEELSQQSEELLQQNEELSQQSEELSQQNEELQSQSEEIQSLVGELGHREDLLQSLLDTTRLASGEHEAMQAVCGAAMSLFGSSAAAVVVYERQDERLLIRASSGCDEAAVPKYWKTEHSLAGVVIEQDRTAAVNDLALRPDLTVLTLPGQPPFQSILCSPIKIVGQVVGCVAIYGRQPSDWTVVHFRLAEWLAWQCAHILETLRAQEEFRRQAALIDLSPDGIFVRRLDGMITLWGHGAETLYGWSKQEALGQSSHALLKTRFPESFERIHEQLERTGFWSGELIHATKDGREVVVESRWLAQRDEHGQIVELLESNVDRTERKRMEEALRASEKRYRSALEASTQVVWTTNAAGQVDMDIPSWQAFTGQTAEQARGLGWMDVIRPDDRPGVVEAWRKAIESCGLYEVDYLLRRHDGVWREIRARGVPVLNDDGSIAEYIGTCIDVTEQRQAQREREMTIEFLRLVNSSSGSRELIETAATFFQRASGCEAVGVRLQDGDDYPYFEARGFSNEFVLLENSLCSRDGDGKPVCDGDGNPVIECMCGNVIAGRFDPALPFFTAHGTFWTNHTTQLLASTTEAQRQARTRNRCNGEGYESVALVPLRVGGANMGLLQLNDRREGLFSAGDIGVWERLTGHLAVALAKFRAQETLAKEQANLQAVFDVVNVGMLVVDEHGCVTRVNDTVSRWVGKDISLHRPEQPGDMIGCLHALNNVAGCGHADQCKTCAIRNAFESVLRNGQPIHDIETMATLRIQDEDVALWIEVSADPLMLNGRRHVILAMNNITARKQAEEALRNSTLELSRSNKDLEQFAYIVSHDLQEPLRVVSGFVQLLQKKYGTQLDADAHQFIEYAVDGVGRMEALIRDLLAYSRIGTRGTQVAPTDAGMALRHALENLSTRIEETSANVTHGEMPTVMADPTQLSQLFQNLVGNALKFRGDAPAKISIEATPNETHWRFSVRDNGIGIAPAFKDRIFMVFQRLHTRREYPGTGIGLAICKRIVERLGGEIWVESEEGQGATFHFTVPMT